MEGLSSPGGSKDTQASADAPALEIFPGKFSDEAGPSTAHEVRPPTPPSSEASLSALNIKDKPKWSGFRKLRIFVQRVKLRRSKPAKNGWQKGIKGKSQTKVAKEKREVFSDPSIMNMHDYDIGELLDFLEKDIYNFFKEIQDAMVKQLISEFRLAAVERLSSHFIRRFP